MMAKMFCERSLQQNEICTDYGQKIYQIAAIPMTLNDFQGHFLLQVFQM